MSENNENKDLESQTEENLNSEIVESDPVAEESNTVEPVVVKKGSFLSFVAFIFSIAALSISGYQYYLQYYKTESINKIEPWQKPLTNLDEKIQKQSNSLTLQISELKKNTQNLNQNLQDIQESNQLILSNKDLPNNTVSDQFDDSEIKQSISGLDQQLATQNKLYEQLQETLANNQQQSLSLLQFKQQYENDKKTQLVAKQVVDPIQKQKSIILELVETNLLTAHRYLNVMGNVDNTVTAIDSAITHLKNLSGTTYTNFITELTSLSESLATDKKIDVFSINKELETLEKNINELKFKNPQVSNENQETSWYDNLVKIKKIDVGQQKLLNHNQQALIRQKLKLHFDLLKSTLINQNQDLWISEINQIKTVISTNFTINSNLVIEKLDQLINKDISPEYPDLSVYIQKFSDLTISNHESE